MYRPYSFWLSMLDATYQSLVQFFIPYFIYSLPTGQYEPDGTIGIMTWGTVVTAGCLLSTFFHLGIDTMTWTWTQSCKNDISDFWKLRDFLWYCSKIWHFHYANFMQSKFWKVFNVMEKFFYRTPENFDNYGKVLIEKFWQFDGRRV